MALKLVVEKLDEVAEPQRALYVEKEGKFHLDVDGLEDTSGLKSALQKERQAAKDARELAKKLEDQYAGIDVNVVRDMMAKFDKDGDAALIAAGKIDEVIAKRTEKLKTEYERRVEAERKNTESAQSTAAKYRQRVLDNNIRAAAAKAGLHSHAIDDALFRARTMFTINEEGEAVQLDDSGTVILGKDGKSPFSPTEWLEDMKDKAPHWYPAGSSGGGAGGSKETTNGKRTMKRSVFNGLGAVERAEAVRTFQIVD